MGAAIPENSPQTATPFGKYLLVKRLAMGGMAELFLAQEKPNPELLVIKRILPYLSEEPEFVQMFLDEARIAAQLHHPNIVQVFELGRINESIFIAMEYVEGVDLRRILAEETKFTASVPYAVAARICAQVASGLDHAHNSKGVDGRPLGLIHRDVSPQNVMVAYNGDVKLVDFGIAKAEAHASRSQPGVIKGKFLYLSPEQVMQEKLDSRSDIFALGVMLYEITAGRTPFARSTTEGILFAIRSENPTPPHVLRDGYPQELSRIVMKCLVKDRTQRYQRASQVEADLEAFLASGVVKQSQDVAAYIARLLGAEEERTQLHVPITGGGRKEGLITPPRHAPRPSLRTPGLPPAVDPEGEEPATEMARPRDTALSRSLGAEEAEPTAIGTHPGTRGARVIDETNPLAQALSTDDEDATSQGVLDDASSADDEEAASQERSGRVGVAGRRSTLPPRNRSPSLASLDRRYGPPIADEDEDEAPEDEELEDEELEDGGDDEPGENEAESGSGETSVESLSLSTQNDRGVGRGLIPRPLRSTSSDTTQDVSGTHSMSSLPTGSDSDLTAAGRSPRATQASRAPAQPRRFLLSMVLMLGLGVLLASTAWHFLASRRSPDAAPPTSRPTPPASDEPSTAVDPDPGTPTAGDPSPSNPTPSEPPPENVPPPDEHGGEPSESTPVAEQGVPVPPDATLGEGVRVQFKAPARSMLWVGRTSVKPNDFLSVEPGNLQIIYRCPGYRGTRGTQDFQVPFHPTGPVVFKLDCKPHPHR